ncbi:MAG: NUDIX domain-containing protein [Erysipelotrichaceae bacterium]|nr:NUDIX domain-containing protein [Erysipelotrichaceae bacterium]
MTKQYRNEAEFLKDYDASQYEKLSLTTDILVFSVAKGTMDNYRKLPDKHFSVLLVKRKTYPFKDRWCLPGGFLRVDEDINEAPKRVLAKETNLHNIYLEQLYTFGAVNRDPRLRVINTAYLALIDKDRLQEKLLSEAAWFTVRQVHSGSLITTTLSNEQECFSFTAQVIDPTLGNEPVHFQIISDDHLAFDNAEVITVGIDRLRNKLKYTSIVFNMMPADFTLKELQQVYEAILGKKLLDPAFRRMISEQVVKTGKQKTGGGHRPSALYRYKKHELF